MAPVGRVPVDSLHPMPLNASLEVAQSTYVYA